MTEVPRLQISEPGDLAQIVPHLVGFRPEDSLVVVVTVQGRVQVTARVDIAEALPPGRAEDLLDRIWNRFPTAGAYLIAYTDDHTAGQALLRRCEDHLPPFADRNSMIIDADTWYTRDGHTGLVDRYGRLAAEATYHGLPVLERRADLQAQFNSPPTTTTLQLAHLNAINDLPDGDDKPALIRRFTTLLDTNLPRPAGPPATPMSQAGALALATLVHDGAVREVAVLSITTANAEDHLRLWRQVINQTPEGSAGMPLFVAGMAAWINGDGATAVIALERAQHILPADSRSLLLLDGLINHVVPPNAWPQMRDAILNQASAEVQHAITDPASPAEGLRWETVRPSPTRPHPEPPNRRPSPPAPGLAL
jgi:hypothetical protein